MIFIRALFLVLLATLPAFAVDITLTIKEQNVVARSGTTANEVVTNGIPIPTANQSETDWACFESTGTTQVPCAISIMPGRVKWLLVSYQVASLAQNATTTIIVRNVAQTATLSSANDVGLTEDSNTIVVDTGTSGIQATISKTSFNFIHEVKLDSDDNGSFETTVVGAPTNPLRINGTRTTAAMATYDFVADTFSWDWSTPHRRILRIDGRMNSGGTDLLKSTLLLEFRAGSTAIGIEWILRNEVQANETLVKFDSAILKFGSGTDTLTHATWGRLDYSNIDTDGLAYQALSAGVPCIPNVAANGGLIIPDMADYSAYLVADFDTGLDATARTNRTNTWKEPLTLRAPATHYSEYGYMTAHRFSTLEEERLAYDKMHWDRTGITEPSEAVKLNYEVDWTETDSHGSSEADDLWYHVLQWVRTGAPGEMSRARAWARFFKYEYPYRTGGFDFAWDTGGEGPSPVSRPAVAINKSENGLPEGTGGPSCNSGLFDDGDWLRRLSVGRNCLRITGNDDHHWMWGAIDYYYITGDKESLNAAIDHAEISDRLFLWRTAGSFYPANSGGRKEARHFLQVIRTYEATLATKWQTLSVHMKNLFMQAATCQGPGLDSTDGCYDSRGFYAEGSAATNASNVLSPPGGYLPYQNGVRATVGFMVAAISQALEWYHIVFNDTAVRDRVVAMASFARQHGLSIKHDIAGTVLAMDWNGSAYSPSQFAFHKNNNQCNLDCAIEPWSFIDSIYNINLVDTLVRGYRYTGNPSYLDRAKLHLDGTRVGGRAGPTGSVSLFCSSANNCYRDRLAVGNELKVSRFHNMNGYPASDVYLNNNGDLMYTNLFAYDAARQNSSWGQAGGSQNLDTGFQGFAFNPSVASDGTNIFAAWVQHRKPDTYEIPGLRVKQWNGSAWAALGGRIGHNTGDVSGILPEAYGPSVAAANGQQTCAGWYEGNNYGWSNVTIINDGSPRTEEAAIFVACWDGDSWEYLPRTHTIPGQLNAPHGQLNYPINASRDPTLEYINGVLYCAFTERDYLTGANNIIVVHWTGTDWVQDGSAFNAGLGSGENIVSMDIVGVSNVPHVVFTSWRKQSTGGTFANVSHSVRVRKLDAGSWVAVGSGQINSASTFTEYASIAEFSSQPTIAYQERTQTGFYKIFIKQWNGSSWASLGDDIRLDTTLGIAGRPSLAVANSVLWVGWVEYGQHRRGQAYVRSWSGSAWNNAEGSLNYDSANGGASRIALAARGTNLFEFHDERLEFPGTRQVYGNERNSSGTIVADTYTRFGSDGTQPTITDNTWISVNPGGVGGLTSGTHGIVDEAFNDFSYDPSIDRNYVLAQYHTSSPGTAEFQNGLYEYDWQKNRWDIVEITESAWSAHLAGTGHAYGHTHFNTFLSAYVGKGNLSLSNAGTKFQFYSYFPRARHGMRMFPAVESVYEGSVNCAYAPLPHNKSLCMGSRSTTSITTWIYDHTTNTTTASTPATSPATRDYPGIAWDNAAQKFILYGGATLAGGNQSDTWTCTITAGNSCTWELKCSGCAPGPRFAPKVAYDNDNQVTLLTAGFSSGQTLDRTAYYYKHATNTWTQTTTIPVDNFPTGSHLAYNRVAKRFYLYSAISPSAFGRTYTYKLVVTAAAGPGGSSVSGGVQIGPGVILR